MEIIWAEEAYAAWQEVADYILQEFGFRAVARFVENTEEWQDALSQSPQIGKIEPLLRNRRHQYRSIVISKQNKLIYYIDKDNIK